MAFSFRALVLAVALGSAGTQSVAQNATIAFGGLKQDTTLPVEVQADQLSVNNADGTAVFTGNVLVGQGEMRLTAAEVRVKYAADGKAIDQLLAVGGVTISNLADAAEAREAVYTIDTGMVVMTGDVLLTQGASAIAGQKLTLDLKAGTGLMEGRVSTTFVPGGD
ncbi:MAG: LptA/OstA family protein [Tabrizicola sp.]|uniref:LptA/OstA family protein n=1 Tax=Tabrizicola sp. TaxID=2005166 RepID=UPI002734C69A|nr:LptA/OstA family protein [Tabrizicola sp.]MDP3261563.1 LptA/OstA family protein [Tabrizicola sp.]MDP3648368.1 LptA/OstA family protein [Paracoccaceae bacterium]MDZ4068373.1 LptA/OstA family protein [Tabrizicola sp.]